MPDTPPSKPWHRFVAFALVALLLAGGVHGARALWHVNPCEGVNHNGPGCVDGHRLPDGVSRGDYRRARATVEHAAELQRAENSYDSMCTGGAPLTSDEQQTCASMQDSAAQAAGGP